MHKIFIWSRGAANEQGILNGLALELDFGGVIVSTETTANDIVYIVKCPLKSAE